MPPHPWRYLHRTQRLGLAARQDFGKDAEVSRPDRWLIKGEGRLHAIHETLELIFGLGSTKCLGMSTTLMELNKVIFEVSVGLLNDESVYTRM